MSLRTRRMSVLAAIVLSMSLLAAGCTKNAQAQQAANLVQQERARHGVRAAHLDARLVNKAQSWADHMARTGRVSHSNLSSGVGSGWRYLAENVGWARSVGEMHSLFMASPSHRSAILDGRYTKFGTGVAVKNGRYYVVQVFGG